MGDEAGARRQSKAHPTNRGQTGGQLRRIRVTTTHHQKGVLT